MTPPGQLDLNGGEVEDPRTERVARALWWRDAQATWGRDGTDVARERAKALWPRQRPHYMATAGVALAAADKT